MPNFSIDFEELKAGRARAGARASAGDGPVLAARLSGRESLRDEELAALFLSDDVGTGELLEIAQKLHTSGDLQIETFAPLYISNECDAECAMCGMRRFNAELQRETAAADQVRAQLEILYRRGMRGVALLTGEYRFGEQRDEMLRRTASGARAALALGFEHVLINIGSLEVEEYALLLEDLPREASGALSPKLTMCTFQETYDPATYRRIMGSSAENPRSDYNRRLRNFDRAVDAGMCFANPGILVGLNRDLAYELMALAAHVRHLESRGIGVYISLPRLRKASGAPHRGGASDDELTRLVSLLSVAFPEAKVVISTREPPEVQHRLLPAIGVLTAGSPGVSPYSDADARFDLEASQFEVADQRPFEEILGDCLAAGATISAYEPPANVISLDR